MEENRSKFQKQTHVVRSVRASSVDEKTELSLITFPEDVIHRIFSFLPIKKAAATSILSRTFQKECPVLNFDESFCSYGKETGMSQREKSSLFIKMVDGALSRYCPHDSTRRSLRFHVNNEHILLGRFKEWLELVKTKKCTDLLLDLPQFYCLPQTVFGLRTLTALHLKGCALPNKRLKGCSILDSLRELHLTNVSRVNILICDLKYICPSIVNFSLIWCSGFYYLVFSGLDKLTEVNVKNRNNIGGITINLRSLQILKLYSRSNCTLLLDIDKKSCINLEALHLDILPGIAGFNPAICSQFPLLKTLSLGSCGSKIRVKIASPVLQKLEFRNTNFVLDSAIDTPNLQFFKYMNYCRGRSIDSHAFPAMASKPLGIKIKLWYSGRCVNTFWFSQLRTFIRNLPSKCVKLSIILDSWEVKFEYEELRDVGINYLPPRVHLLKLKIKSNQENCSKLVDGFFWSCRPNTLTVQSHNSGIMRESVEALHKEFASKGRKQNCCSSNHCWRHYLKDEFEIEQLFGAKHPKTNFYMKW